MATKKAYVSYAEKLRDPRWQKKRLEIMSRADFKCERCGDESSMLAVHHGYYERGKEPWEYEEHTLHCLCDVCHKAAEGDRAELQFYVGGLDTELIPDLTEFVWCWKLLTKDQRESLLKEAFNLALENE